MVVVNLQPAFWFMERSGIASGTREVAMSLWKGKLPKHPPAELTRALYYRENSAKREPSGSQDMVGLIYPGINRLDYDFGTGGGVFPSHIESLQDTASARWLEKVLHVLPVAPRPEGYSPLGKKELDPKWIARLGQTGKDCFEAIRRRDLRAFGASLNACMTCWEKILPRTVRHPALRVDLIGLLRVYQAMYSGCGGGYLFVASKDPVPGSFTVRVRTARGAKP